MTDLSVLAPPRVTVEDLYNLPVTPAPEAPKRPKLAPKVETAKPLEALWKPFGSPASKKYDLRVVKVIHSLTTPATIREALGFSQSQFAKVLAIYLGRPVTPGSIGMYEYAYRSTGHTFKKYAPTAQVADAYRRILEDAVALASEGQLRLKSRLFKTVWRFDLIGHCKKGDHDFTLKRSHMVNCPRHTKRTRSTKKGVKRS